MAAIGKLAALGALAKNSPRPRDGANVERASDGPALKVGDFAFHDVRKVVLRADQFTLGADETSAPKGKPPAAGSKPADGSKAAEGKTADAAKPAETKPADKDKILEKAKGITSDNGVDEIYFRTESGDLFVAAFRGSANGVKAGYLGRFGGQKIEVLHVDDESNTFREGVKSTFSWTDSTFKNVAGQEVTKALGTVVGTIAGGLIAAAALKGTSAAPAVATTAIAAANPAVAAAAATAATAVAQAATNTAGTAAVTAGSTAAGTVAGTVVVNAAKSGATAVKGALGGAMRTVIMVGVPIAVIGGIVFGTSAILGGLKASRRRSDFGTIDMVTDKF